MAAPALTIFQPSRPFALPLTGAAIAIVAWIIMQAEAQMLWMFTIALAMGVALYHASYGFSGAYRDFFVRRDTRGIDSQIILLGLTTVLFAPVLSQGSAFGNAVGGAVAPVGIGMAAGAFLFGIGMQLGGACASGSLYTAGSGNPRMVIVLVFFCAGAFWGSLDLGWWQSLPSLPALSLAGEWGWEIALPAQLAMLGLLYFSLRRYRQKKNIQESAAEDMPLTRRLLRGPWPLIWGGVSLAFLNWLTLVSLGHPWAITWGFTLWGAKIAALVGWDPLTSGFWTGGFQQQALEQPLWRDTTSVMNLGILAGATFAMLIGGRKAAKWDRRIGPLLAAIVGGLMLGYGARLAYGCNIGAFISGAASTSLHGWVWILCALPGNWIGMKMRRFFWREQARSSKA